MPAHDLREQQIRIGPRRVFGCSCREGSGFDVEAGLGDKIAIIFEADNGQVTKVTYKEMLSKVSKFANALRAQGQHTDDDSFRYDADSGFDV